MHRARPRRVRGAARARGDRADHPRRPVRRRDHDGPAQQRAASPTRWTSTSPTPCSAAPASSAAARGRPAFATALYWEPTVLDRRPGRRAGRGRGDVRPDRARSSSIDSLEHAISLTNASPYGLLAAIFTADLANGLEFADRVRTGWVNINESSNYWESHLPFGGRAGSDSGIGRVGGTHVMHVVHRAADGRAQRPPLARPGVIAFGARLSGAPRPRLTPPACGGRTARRSARAACCRGSGRRSSPRASSSARRCCRS